MLQSCVYTVAILIQCLECLLTTIYILLTEVICIRQKKLMRLGDSVVEKFD